jgi:hypothetical protein
MLATRLCACLFAGAVLALALPVSIFFHTTENPSFRPLRARFALKAALLKPCPSESLLQGLRMDLQERGGFLTVKQRFKSVVVGMRRGRLMCLGMTVIPVVVGIRLLHLNASSSRK